MTDDLVERLRRREREARHFHQTVYAQDLSETIARITALEAEVGWLKRDHNTAQADLDIMKAKAELMELENARMREALELAQKWLLNCMPVVDLGEPYPLPVIAEALQEGE